MRGRFYSVGIGPGDPEYITLKAKRVLEDADIIAVPVKKQGEKSTAFEIVKDIVDLKDKKILKLQFLMSKEHKVRINSRNTAVEAIISKLNEGKNIAMITLGDVSVYSTCTYVNQQLKKDGFESEIISGIPSFCAGAARAHVSLCEGDETLAIVPSVKDTDYIETVIRLFDNIIIMKPRKEKDRIYDILKNMNLLEHAIVMSRVGMSGEIVKTIGSNIDYGYFTTILIKKGGTKQ
ncbi:MAG: precorrin-2 C(20)-methyltransferase [Clostridia bacterium]|nr:precorrin-2 C(20)-methyltransferase [Clostridia bacterium]